MTSFPRDSHHFPWQRLAVARMSGVLCDSTGASLAESGSLGCCQTRGTTSCRQYAATCNCCAPDRYTPLHQLVLHRVTSLCLGQSVLLLLLMCRILDPMTKYARFVQEHSSSSSSSSSTGGSTSCSKFKAAATITRLLLQLLVPTTG
jgi:hypothetical protein